MTFGVPGPSPSPLPFPRGLRRAAGVGPRRSVDLARFLWREGPDADLERLAGVGPRTARAAQAVLVELLSAPTPGAVSNDLESRERARTAHPR